MRKNKKGIELSINFIVTLILALAAFALGAVIIRTLTSSGMESMDLTADQVHQRITELTCSATDIVCMSDNFQNVNRGDFAAVGVFVLNIYTNPNDVKIVVTPKKYYPASSSPSVPLNDPPISPEPQLIYSTVSKKIDSKSQGEFDIGLATKKSTPKGKYTYKVSVEPNNPVSAGGTDTFQPKIEEITIIVK